jgi:hypothetical protein
MQLYGSFCYRACFEGKLIRAGSKQEKPRNGANSWNPDLAYAGHVKKIVFFLD